MLGPYQIVESLGAGGMGEVYKARDTRLERTVAIKVLGGHLTTNEDLRQRFEREAKTISSLSHPHICTLYDVGVHDDNDFLVMEYLEGETLADLLSKGPLPMEQVLAFGAQIAAALDKAHKQGVVHRDIKPGNVMITKSGVKLLDFGLAKYQKSAESSDGQSVLATAQKPLTQEGTIVGTFQYMAPEQLEGEDADPRTDIFSFGAVLYEMATGRRAFQGKTRTSLIAAIVSSNPQPISELQPVTPPAFERVVRVCLRKDPDDRWQTAHDVMLELQWIGEAGSQAGVAAPVVARRKTRERLAWAIAALLTIATAALGYLSYRAMSKEERVLRLNLVPSAGITPVYDGESTNSLTISPDGRWMTFAGRDESRRNMLWLRALDSSEAKAIEGSEDAASPFWSPDSRFLAFFAGGKLKKASVTGAPPLNLCDVRENPRAGSWNRDGVIIFSPSSVDPIFRIDAAGGTPESLTSLDTEKAETTHRWSTFLPDGNHFIYMAGTHTAGIQAEGNAIYVASLAAPSERKLILHGRSNVVYSKGHLLYVRDNVLVAQRFDVKKLELDGDPFPVVAGVSYAPDFFRGLFTVAENGTVLYYPGTVASPLQLVWLDRTGREIGPIGEPAFFSSVQPSPDGRKIALEITDPNTGSADIWIEDVERNVRSRFTFGELDESAPVWSPDGNTIYFSKRTELLPDIFRKNLVGSAEETVVVEMEGWQAPFSISDDGKWLTFVTLDMASNQNVDTMALRLDGSSKPVSVISGKAMEAGGSISPDESKLAYQSNETGRFEVYVSSFPEPGRRWQISNNGGGGPYWTRDGREILYHSVDGKLMSVKVRSTPDDLEIGSSDVLFDESDFEGVAPTADARRFLATKRNKKAGTDTIVFLSDWLAVAQADRR